MLNELLYFFLAVLAIGFSSFNYPGNSATAGAALADIHKESANTAIAFQEQTVHRPPITELEANLSILLHKTSAPEAPEKSARK
ncbi:MAG: hypothetical protein R3D26_06135 [Cyanobacteriota/Melainabacteria group bacterium]